MLVSYKNNIAVSLLLTSDLLWSCEHHLEGSMKLHLEWHSDKHCSLLLSSDLLWRYEHHLAKSMKLHLDWHSDKHSG